MIWNTQPTLEGFSPLNFYCALTEKRGELHCYDIFQDDDPADENFFRQPVIHCVFLGDRDSQGIQLVAGGLN